MTEANLKFQDLSLAPAVLTSLKEVGYEIPTPIQAQTIPLVLAGRDVVGQAQTGTGKTAAFALPLLSRVDLKRRDVQVLVLAPTRELAIQVAEAFQRYAAHMKGFHVLPIYGGQAYDGQLRGLKRGVHVVVGTPGRVMDHMRRKTLRLDKLQCLVLDEADEMLRMGFIDDVEWILEQTPVERQTALFSATMPAPIRRIAEKHLRNPEHIAVKESTTVTATISQHHWMVSGKEHKLDALTRILEAETFDGVLVFVRTRIMTVELAEKLQARGYDSAGLSGDMPQNRRERTVDQLKKGKLDILVATDVAARGLDIDRISHVINFDIPADAEAYIHRIGRTGRAGRTGKAILFVAPRERRLLYAIERATKQKIPLLELPSTEMINDKRIARFKQSLTDVLASEDLGLFRMILEQYRQEHNVAAVDIASALARMVQGDEPLLLTATTDRRPHRQPRTETAPSDGGQDVANGSFRPKPRPKPSAGGKPEKVQAAITQEPSAREKTPRKRPPEPSRERPPTTAVPPEGMERFRIEVGENHGIEVGNLVGALTGETPLEGDQIGHIEVHDEFSLIDLPAGMRRELFDVMKKVRVRGHRLRLSTMDSQGTPGGNRPGGRKGYLKGPKTGSGKPASGKGKGTKGGKGVRAKPKRKKDRHRNRGKKSK